MSFTTETMLTSPAGFGLTTASPLQRAICRVLDGLPLGELARDTNVIVALGGDDAIATLPTAPPSEVVVLAAIRTATSMTAGAAALVRALNCDVSRLAPGEVPRVAIVSITRDLAEVVYRHIRGTIEARPLLRALLLEEPKADSLLVRHPSGRAVEIKVAPLASSGSALIARWLVGVIFDEAPRMVGADDGVRNLSDARTASIGRLLDGGQILTIGSPWAPFGPVYDLVQSAWGKPSPRLVVVRGTGPRMNPEFWTLERCAKLEASDPVAYRTDVLGEFADPESSLFSTDEIAKATRPAPLDLPREEGHDYFAAMDPGTRGNAWTFVIVTGKYGASPTAPLRHVVVLARQWIGSKAAPLSPDAVLREIGALCRAYGVTFVLTDQWASDALRDIAARHDVSLIIETATAARKVELFETLRTRLSAGDVELPPDPVLREDLLGVRKRVTQNGIAIHLPHTSDGRHADYAAALALSFARRAREPSGLPPRAGTAEWEVAEQERIKADIIRESRRRQGLEWWESRAGELGGGAFED